MAIFPKPKSLSVCQKNRGNSNKNCFPVVYLSLSYFQARYILIFLIAIFSNRKWWLNYYINDMRIRYVRWSCLYIPIIFLHLNFRLDSSKYDLLGWSLEEGCRQCIQQNAAGSIGGLRFDPHPFCRRVDLPLDSPPGGAGPIPEHPSNESRLI